MNKIVRKIADQPLSRVYVIHGSDSYQQQQVYHALNKRAVSSGLPEWNWVNISADKNLELTTIINELRTTPWGNGEKIVAVRDADLIQTSVIDRLVNWFEKHKQSNCLALFFLKVNRRLRSVKRLLEISTEIKCERLKGEALVRWVQDYLSLRGKKITKPAVNELLQRVGDDLHLIANELDKLLLYVMDQQTVTETDITAITSITFGQLQHGVVFTMVESIAAKDLKTALNILHQLLDANEPALKILPLIDRQIRLVLAVKTKGLLSIDDVAKAMGESSSYSLRKAQKYQENFTLDQLYQGFKRIIATDSELKFGAQPRAALENLIISLCG